MFSRPIIRLDASETQGLVRQVVIARFLPVAVAAIAAALALSMGAEPVTMVAANTMTASAQFTDASMLPSPQPGVRESGLRAEDLPQSF